jgi:hypothetical protein
MPHEVLTKTLCLSLLMSANHCYDKGIVVLSKKLQMRKKVTIAQKSCKCTKYLQMQEIVANTQKSCK